MSIIEDTLGPITSIKDSEYKVMSVEEISEVFGDKKTNYLSIDFLNKLLLNDSSQIEMKDKLKKLKENIMSLNSEYLLMVRYGIKPKDKVLESLYQTSHEFSIDVRYILCLFDKKDQFNYTDQEMLSFIKDEINILSREKINLIYSGYENDNDFTVSNEYNERSKKYSTYIQDQLIKKYNLYK